MKTTVCGRDIEYGVDEKTGIFGASWNGEQYQHKTLDGLKGMLERQLKKKPLNIKVVKIENGWRDEEVEITKGVIVGVHSGNRNLLIKWDGKTTAEQYKTYRGSLYNLTIDTNKVKQLKRAARVAGKAFEDYLRKHQFDRESIKDEAETE